MGDAAGSLPPLLAVGPLSVGRADACPFQHGFQPGFNGCAKYEPTLFRTVSYIGGGVRERFTCRFLTVGGDQGVSGPWYPRCELGGPPDFPKDSRSH